MGGPTSLFADENHLWLLTLQAGHSNEPSEKRQRGEGGGGEGGRR